MSYIFRSDEVALGDRVVVRRLIEGYAHDVIGHVLSLEPLVIRPQEVGGFPSSLPTVEVPPEQLLIIKRLSPRRIRNSEIRHLTSAYVQSFPATQRVWTSDQQWLMLVDERSQARRGVAAPLGRSAGFTPLPLAELTEFYRGQVQDFWLLIPERIGSAAEKLAEAHKWELSEEFALYTCRIEPVGDDANAPEPEGIHTVVTSSENDATWLGIFPDDDNVTPRIVTTRIKQVLALARQEQSAETAYVVVNTTDTELISQLDELGFIEHHRHRYARVPVI